jgi:hypothetical protein
MSPTFLQNPIDTLEKTHRENLIDITQTTLNHKVKKAISYLILFPWIFLFAQNSSLAQNPASKAVVSRLVSLSDNGDFDHCVALLKDGLRDEYTSNASGSFFENSKSYFSSDQFVYDYHAGKWNGGISVVIDDVPLGLNAGASDNDIHTFQQKIRSSNSLVVNSQTYATISRSPINVDLANSYNTCVENTQTFGLTIDLTGSDDNTANVTVNYRPLSSTDLHPKIKSVQLVGLDDYATQSLLNSTLKVGTTVLDHTSFSAYRKPGQPMIIVINTSNGLSIVKKLEGSADDGSGNSPIGTIIVSTFDFDTFSRLTKNNSATGNDVWSPIKSKWAPCDGRDVTGSKYQTKWAGALGPLLPDLRGVFLRGLNQFDYREPNQVATFHANPEEKHANEFQTDAVGKHSHTIDVRTGYMLQLGVLEKIKTSIFVGDRPAYADSYGNLTAVEDPNAKETRPKNVSVYYYIRIN